MFWTERLKFYVEKKFRGKFQFYSRVDDNIDVLHNVRSFDALLILKIVTNYAYFSGLIDEWQTLQKLFR